MTDRMAEIRASIERLQHRPYRRTDHKENADITLKYRLDIPYLLDLLAERDAEIERLQAAQRWIPVTVGLPEPNTETLVLTDAGSIRQGYIGHATGHWCSGGFVMVPTVTHWMPLPAPPEVDDAK